MQLQERKHYEDEFTLGPICTGFGSLDDRRQPDGGHIESREMKKQESIFQIREQNKPPETDLSERKIIYLIKR